MIYVASPYSHPDAVVRRIRAERVMYYCADLMRKNKTCFSPIVYGHQFALLGLAQTDHIWWQEFNEVMLRNSSEIHVFMLSGWKESEGIKHELKLADEYGIEVTFV